MTQVTTKAQAQGKGKQLHLINKHTPLFFFFFF